MDMWQAVLLAILSAYGLNLERNPNMETEMHPLSLSKIYYSHIKNTIMMYKVKYDWCSRELCLWCPQYIYHAPEKYK